MSKVFAFFILFFLSSHAFASGIQEEKMQLVFAIDLFRHAERTPLRKLNSFSSISFEVGSLTKNGYDESFNLGKNLKHYYASHNLDLNQCSNDKVLFRSTNLSRTIETAKTVTLSLCNNSESVQVIYYPLGQDDVIYPLIDKKYFIYKFEDKELIKISALSSALQIDRILPDDSSDKDLVTLNDYISLYGSSNNVLKKITPSLKNDINDIAIKSIFSLFQTTELSCQVVRNLFPELKKLILGKVNNISTINYVFFAVHDINLLSFLKIINFPIRELPPYLGNIKIEMLQSTNSKLYIKISYNNTPIKIQNFNLIPLDIFLSYLEKSYITHCE